MLWQPSLPERYRTMSGEDLAAAISARREELGAQLVILGHHYQTDEVIRHADHTGDSLKLSQIAAGLVRERAGATPVRYIIFCGVHFMAETADMLTPDDVSVILPDISAGCSMADMAAYDDTVDAWNALHSALAADGWRGRIIPITYVNSTAAIKAFVGANGGACCTSSNAATVFAWALAGGEQPVQPGEEIKILFLPDQHLGRNTAAAAGIDTATGSCVYDPKLARAGEPLGGASPEELRAATVVLWAGHCSVHKLFRPEHCAQVRAADRENGTHTTILVHPECCKEVVDLADMSGSTEHIIQTIAKAPEGSRWAVGTEVHLVNRIARLAAARGVHVRMLSDCHCLCTTMYRIDQPHLLWVLDHLVGKADDGKGKPKVVNRVQVHPDARAPALLALDRMLSLAHSARVPVE